MHFSVITLSLSSVSAEQGRYRDFSKLYGDNTRKVIKSTKRELFKFDKFLGNMAIRDAAAKCQDISLYRVE